MLLIAFSSKGFYKRVHFKGCSSPRRSRLWETTNHVPHRCFKSSIFFQTWISQDKARAINCVGQTSGWPCENVFILDNELCVYHRTVHHLRCVVVSAGFFSNTIAWLINIDHFLSLDLARVSSLLLWTQREAWRILTYHQWSLSVSLPHTLARLFSFFSFSNLRVPLLFRAVLFISMREKSSMWLTSGLHLQPGLRLYSAPQLPQTILRYTPKIFSNYVFLQQAWQKACQ